KSSEAGGVEDASHADDALARKTADLVSGLRHGVERVRDDDENAVRRVMDDLADDVAHDFEVGIQQIVAAHAGLAWNSGGNDDDVGVGGIGIVVGPENRRVALLDGHGLEQIKTFALGNAFDDVDEDDIGQFFRGNPMCGGSAYVSRTYDRYFIAHNVPFFIQNYCFSNTATPVTCFPVRSVPE